MVKSELVQSLCNMHPGIIRKDIEKIVEIIIFEMIEALCRNEAIEIRGWGRIKTVVRKPRIGRNPKNFKTIFQIDTFFFVDRFSKIRMF